MLVPAITRSHVPVLLGRLDEAQRLGDRLVDCFASQRGLEAHAHHLFGDIATHPDRFDADRGEAEMGMTYSLEQAAAETAGLRSPARSQRGRI